MKPFPGIRCRPRIFAIFDWKCSYIDDAILPAQFASLLEQLFATVDVCGVKYPGRQFSFIQQTPDQRQPTASIAKMKVHYPGLFTQQTGHVHFRGQSCQLLKSRLA